MSNFVDRKKFQSAVEHVRSNRAGLTCFPRLVTRSEASPATDFYSNRNFLSNTKMFHSTFFFFEQISQKTKQSYSFSSDLSFHLRNALNDLNYTITNQLRK